MKKLALLLVAIFGFTLGMSGQTSFGVRSSIGVTIAPNETTFSGQVFDYINHEVQYKGSNIVKSYGIFAQKKFGYLFAKTELSYTNFTQEYGVRSFVQFGQGNKSVFEKFDFIDLQVLAGLTHNNVRLGVGPVAHILVGHDAALDFISGYNENLRPLTFGFATIVGLDTGIFHIDVKYENNFRTVGDHIYYGNRDAGFKAKPHVVSLTVGISI